MDDIEKKILESKILVIDDDINMGMMLEEVLKMHDYTTVRYICDSRQAEEVYKQYHPDLILLDIRMPHMDGFQVMQMLKTLQNGSFLPILVLTGETDESFCLRALEAGASDFIHKPIKVTEVLARIRNMLKVRQLQNQLEGKKDFLEEKVRDRTEQLRQMVGELDRSNAKIREAYVETIYHLTRATEYRDGETADHVKRMSLYSAAMGKALGLDSELVELLLYASPMHDIGKIGIPDKILFKGEGLDKDEWNIMMTHTTIGYEILSDSPAPVLKLGAEIALGHHERWDGTGYPKGLKGEEIPLTARIVKLVDVYDALRSKRHYKNPFAHEIACKIILEGDGRVLPQHFDPKLLNLFREIHPELQKIFDANNK
jgi:putative two-component system response regulator